MKVVSSFCLNRVVEMFYAELFVAVYVGVVVKNERCESEVVLVCVSPDAVSLYAVGVVLKPF